MFHRGRLARTIKCQLWDAFDRSDPRVRRLGAGGYRACFSFTEAEACDRQGSEIRNPTINW